MPSFVLTDASTDRYVEDFALSSEDAGSPSSPAWTVTKARLRGGRRDGVDVIRVAHGSLSLTIVPTRGMNLWKGNFGKNLLGWASPVRDGPVHPNFVDLHAWGGLGWLDGFDELLARCGLDSYGPPYTENGRAFTLHGRISNIPAHYVAVHVDEAPPYALTIEGHVTEARLFHTQVRMITRISTAPGSNRITVRDEFTNLRDVPGDLQVLYHWNFGAPLMGEGAKFVAPSKTVVPRDRAAVAGLGHFDTYGPPDPGSPEQVFFFELLGDGPEGRTLALLRNRAGDAGVAMRFATSQLPAFTLWKNQGGANEGYVTGLEPGTGYPNPKPFEAARRRVLSLAPGQTYVAETTLEVADSIDAVSAIEAEIRVLQAKAAPTVHGSRRSRSCRKVEAVLSRSYCRVINPPPMNRDAEDSLVPAPALVAWPSRSAGESILLKKSLHAISPDHAGGAG